MSRYHAVYDRPTHVPLIRQAARGNPLAAEVFSRLYGPVIQSMALRKGFTRDAAEDLARDMLMDLITGKIRYSVTRGRFRGLLAKCTRRRIKRILESKAREAANSEEYRASLPRQNEDDDFFKQWDAAHKRECLRAAINDVRSASVEATFRTWELVRVREVPAPEVAEIMGKSIASVYQCCHRVDVKIHCRVAELLTV